MTTSLLSSPEVISTIHVEGNATPIQRNPPVAVLSTCTDLAGLILMCTVCSRTRLTLPTITSSPCVIDAVVIRISARALPSHMTTQTVATAKAARTNFASMTDPGQTAHTKFDERAHCKKVRKLS